MRPKNVHLPRMLDTGLCTVNLFSRPRSGRLAIELAQLYISLLHRVGVDGGRNPDSSRTPASRGGVRRQIGSRTRFRFVIVGQPFGVGTPVTFQLLFDPIYCAAVAFGSLASVAELRETLNGRFVFVQIQAVYKGVDRILSEGGPD